MDKMKKILVVDDESDICLTLAIVLEDNRFVVRPNLVVLAEIHC